MGEPFDDLEPWGYGSELEAPVVVLGLELALPVVAIAILLAAAVRAGWRSRQAARVEAGAATAPLTPGPAVIRGVVAGDPGDAAVRVTVEQLGLEQSSKGRWTTHWREISRRTDARPFEIVRDDGSRVRVEPGAAPTLLDVLSTWIRIGHDRRRATASLTPGETVVARGALTMESDARMGYRGASSPVLRAPPGEPMSLSTLGLAAPARAAAGRARVWAVALGAAVAIAQLLALPYHAAVHLGETRSATVVERRMVRGSGSKNPDRYFVTYRVEGTGDPIEEQVSIEDHARLPEGTLVPARVSPLETTLGPHPTSGPLVLAGLLVLPFTMLAVWMGLRRRAWYERPVHDSVDGRLDTAPPPR